MYVGTLTQILCTHSVCIMTLFADCSLAAPSQTNLYPESVRCSDVESILLVIPMSTVVSMWSTWLADERKKNKPARSSFSVEYHNYKRRSELLSTN